MADTKQVAEGAYTGAWTDYKNRRKLLFFLILGFVPIAGVVGGGLSTLTNSEIPFQVIGGIWFLSVPVALGRLSLFPCPRCGEIFGGLQRISLSLKPKCCHCGLTLDTPSDPGNLAADLDLRGQETEALKIKGWVFFVPFSFGLLAIIATLMMVFSGSPEPVLEVGSSVVNDLRKGDYKNAKLSSTKAFGRQLDSAKFQMVWGPFTKRHPAAGGTSSGAGGWPTSPAVVSYPLGGMDGTTGRAVVVMVKEGDKWKVDGMWLFENEEDLNMLDSHYAQGKAEYKPGMSWWFPGGLKNQPTMGKRGLRIE